MYAFSVHRPDTDAFNDSTDRLDLYRPTPDDVPGLHAIFSDARVWTHYPSLRHTTVEQTRATVEGWMSAWDDAGLGVWVARERGTEAVIGYGGCSVLGSVLGGKVWNLGYRFSVEVQGRGLATELGRKALERAALTRPDRAVVAYLLEHNLASAAVARKLGLTLVDHGPDAGNPDPAAVRLIFASRPLTALELAAARH